MTLTYACAVCGFEAARYFDRCPECEQLCTCGKLVRNGPDHEKTISKVLRLSEIECASETRTLVLPDWDQVLSGGLTENMIILVPGRAGGGKTSEMLRVANVLGSKSDPVLFLLSERRPPGAIALRARQLSINPNAILFQKVRSSEEIVELVEQTGVRHVILDSWGGIKPRDREVSHVGEVRSLIGAGSFWIICQVTKAGDLAGESALEHEVDATVWVSAKKLRCTKNWHGRLTSVSRTFLEPAGSLPGSPAPKKRGTRLRLVR